MAAFPAEAFVCASGVWAQWLGLAWHQWTCGISLPGRAGGSPWACHCRTSDVPVHRTSAGYRGNKHN